MAAAWARYAPTYQRRNELGQGCINPPGEEMEAVCVADSVVAGRNPCALTTVA
jgi:hypothetical protein